MVIKEKAEYGPLSVITKAQECHRCAHVHTLMHTQVYVNIQVPTGPEVGRPGPGLSSPETGKSGPPGTWGHLGPALMAQACQKVSKALRVIVSSLRNSNKCCLKEQQEREEATSGNKRS